MSKKKPNHNYKVRRCKHKSSLKQKKSKKRKRNSVEPAEASHQSVEKGLSEICATLSQLEVQKESATNVFLRSNGIERNSIADSAKERKKVRSRRTKKSRNKNFSTLQLLAALPDVSDEPRGDEGQSIAQQVPVKIVKKDFLYSQRDSKKLYKKILRRERSKQRHQKHRVL